jgi:hypothetical protein
LCWKLESTYVMCQLSFLHRISPQFLLVCKTPQVLPFQEHIECTSCDLKQEFCCLVRCIMLR